MKKMLLIINFFLIFFLINCAQEVKITGHVFVEDDGVTNSAWKNDNWFDYKDGGNVTIKCGKVKTQTDNKGNFTLSGSMAAGTIMIEASRSSFQTAYVFVNYSDLTSENYYTTVNANDQILMVSCLPVTNWWNSQLGGYGVRTNSSNIENTGLTILLIKEPDASSNWNVFKYNQ